MANLLSIFARFMKNIFSQEDISAGIFMMGHDEDNDWLCQEDEEECEVYEAQRISGLAAQRDQSMHHGIFGFFQSLMKKVIGLFVRSDVLGHESSRHDGYFTDSVRESTASFWASEDRVQACGWKRDESLQQGIELPDFGATL